MVVALAMVGIFGVVLGGIWCFGCKQSYAGPIIVMLLSLCCIIAIPFTPQGKLHWKQLTATASGGNWLVIDNSGGETLRHWLLEDIFVQSSSQSDGWEFYDECGNLCYVSGDAFVMRINTDLDEQIYHNNTNDPQFAITFRQKYKKIYNIPEDQEPCECE